MKKDPAYHRLWAIVGVLVFLLVGLGNRGPAMAQTKGAGGEPEQPPVLGARGTDLIVVSADEPWMAAIAAPVAGKLRHVGRAPLLIAAEYPPSSRANWLMTWAAPQQTVVLCVSEPVRLGPVLSTLSPKVLAIGIDPAYGSLAVAKRFWKRARQVVAAPADDMEAILLGASLADRLSAPLVIRPRNESKTDLFRALRGLGVEEILAAVSDPGRPPRWAEKAGRSEPDRVNRSEPGRVGPSTGDRRVEIASSRAIEKSVVAGLGAENIRTLVLARVPDKSVAAGPTAWLAPYLGIARGAPLVLCHTSSAKDAETEVAGIIRRHGLRPRTVTILADYPSIGSELVQIDAEAKGANGVKAANGTNGASGAKKTYEVQREPCVPAESPEAAALGVGRFPMASLADTSVMFARGLVRERILVGRPGRVLMVSNPSLERRPLPLCEVISRLTAQEFKNFKIPVNEFYGKLADGPEVLSAARSASLMIYEGHVSYQDLIYTPYSHARAPDDYYEEARDALENHSGDAAAEPPRESLSLPSPPVPPSLPALPVPAAKPSRLEEPLGELPIVVLQSCDSLDEELLDRADALGCTAVIGSVTPIHSGSGSMLVQALADAVLYQRDTLGESLRDAQNFLFCLGDLKIQRGLKEYAKSRRVALSFRLWGDPELAVFTAPPGRPRGKPVAASWMADGALRIEVPPARFPEVRSSRYRAQMFPGSQSAGLVKKPDGDGPSKVLPAYYVRVPTPDGWSGPGGRPELPKSVLGQAAFRIDPLGRFVYLVYLPGLERAGETIVVRWTTPLPAEPSKTSNARD